MSVCLWVRVCVCMCVNACVCVCACACERESRCCGAVATVVLRFSKSLYVLIYYIYVQTDFCIVIS